MAKTPPRYDLPNAAPEPLRLVQSFVNTTNLENGDDWLASWLTEHGVKPRGQSLARARDVREAVRELLYANNGQVVTGDPHRLVSDAAAEGRLTIDFASGSLVPRAPGLAGVLGRVVAMAFTAMADGSWGRLKACRNHHCRWAFYDYSKNRSASWCSMQLCGNRTKTRAYRARHTRA
jgi:predicted RNA-binding Zn ribbon-like protein